MAVMRGAKKALYSPTSTFQSFSEPTPLDYKYKLSFCFVLFLSSLAGIEWLEWARVGYFPSPIRKAKGK